MTDTTTTFFQSQSLTVDDKFNAEARQAGHLILKLSPDRLEVAIIELNTNRSLQVEDFALGEARDEKAFFLQCAKFLSNHPLYGKTDWGRISWVVRGRKFSLVPQQLFDASSPEIFLEPIALFAPGYDVVQHYQHKNGIVNVYAVEQPLISLIEQVYGRDRVQVVHAVSAFCEGLVQGYSLTQTGKEMFVLVENRALLIAVRHHGQILYCNAFACQNEAEIAYYTLLAAQETGMELRQDSVSLYGHVDRESKAYRALYPYMKYLFLGERPTFVSFSNQFDKLAANRFYDLFAAHICS